MLTKEKQILSIADKFSVNDFERPIDFEFDAGANWGYDGYRLLPREIADINHEAGFTDIEKLEDSVMIVMAESLGYVRAWHQNLDANGVVTSTDWTNWQINDKSHPEIVSLKDAPDSPENRLAIAKLAHSIYAGWSYTFGPWAAFNNKAYLKFLPAGVVGPCNARAKERGLTPLPYVVLSR